MEEVRDIVKKSQDKLNNNGWKPIETAPKEITTIIAYDQYSDYWKMQIIDYGKNHCSHGCFEPTHWMPLPEPPKE